MAVMVISLVVKKSFYNQAIMPGFSWNR